MQREPPQPPPELAILVDGGILQEVVTSRQGRLRYRLVDMDTTADQPFFRDMETSAEPVDIEAYTKRFTEEPTPPSALPSISSGAKEPRLTPEQFRDRQRFPVTQLCRQDIKDLMRGIPGSITEAMIDQFTDQDVQEIANRMAELYLGDAFWDDLAFATDECFHSKPPPNLDL